MCEIQKENNDDKNKEVEKESILKAFEKIIIERYELIIAIIGVLGLIVSKAVIYNYKRKCEEYYNISMQYFDGKQRLESVEIFGILTLLLIVYPIIIYIMRRYLNDKIEKVMTFIALACIFIYQSLTYVECIIEYVNRDYLQNNGGLWTVIVILVIADVAFSHFLVFKENKVIGIISFSVIIITVIVGIFAGLSFNAENKMEYEILDDGKSAVISTYEGKFVVMDCKIYGNNNYLYLDNTKYRLEEMAGHDIQSITFDSVGFDKPQVDNACNCLCK